MKLLLSKEAMLRRSSRSQDHQDLEFFISSQIFKASTVRMEMEFCEPTHENGEFLMRSVPASSLWAKSRFERLV